MSDEARLRRLEDENRMLRQGVQQAARMRQLWEQALAELQATKHQLEASNTQLSTLYQVASAINQTIDLQGLFERIMQAMEGALEASRGQPMAIFLVDGEHMRLVAHGGGSAEFVEAHQDMRVGDCLCGRAAAGGEVLCSDMCCQDERHTIRYTSMEKHGHVIVPLMAKGKAVGVFCYYVPCGMRLQPGQRDTFVAIGQQLGMAIENARLYEETRQLSLLDTLTGLGNRRLMELVLDRDLPNVRRYGRALSVVMLDVDHFKRYNDEHGHPAGDRLLAEIGAILRRETRENDLPVRYGGEEFLVILPETDATGARSLAERLRTAVATDTGVTVSLGVAQAGPTHGERLALLQAADAALYQAKADGRNRVVVAD
ncbi:MAG: diguanylate cyclase [Thiohalomonadaceae bacterium]